MIPHYIYMERTKRKHFILIVLLNYKKKFSPVLFDISLRSSEVNVPAIPILIMKCFGIAAVLLVIIRIRSTRDLQFRVR